MSVGTAAILFLFPWLFILQLGIVLSLGMLLIVGLTGLCLDPILQPPASREEQRPMIVVIVARSPA